MEIALGHLDTHGKQRRSATRRERRAPVGVVEQLGDSLHAQRLAGAGDQENQSHLRVLENVGKRKDELVALALRDQQRASVLDLHETGQIALG